MKAPFALLLPLVFLGGSQAAAHAAPAAQKQARKKQAPKKQRSVIPPKPGTSSDTLHYVRVTDQPVPIRVQNAEIQASSRTAVHFYKGGPWVGTVFRDVLIHVAPRTLDLDRSYWAVRGYDMIDTVFERVEITGFGVVTPKHDEGHAIYLNLAGSFSLLDCKIHHNGGQGLQIVNRPGESSLPRGPAKGAITIKDTVFRENGFNPDRGSFQISIFGTGQDIRMENVAIYAGFDETEWPGGRTTGALLIEAEGYSGNPDKLVWYRPHKLPENFSMPYSQGKVELINVRVRHRKPDRPLMQIKGCEELIVRNSTFEGGDIHLDRPEKAGRISGRIVWENNTGSAPVYHKGKLVGLARNNFTFEIER